MLQCFVCSLIPKVSEKKWATGQNFIRKEITSYRIVTLTDMPKSGGAMAQGKTLSYKKNL